MIDPKRVNAIFLDCLFHNGEDTTNHIAVEGLIANFGFHPGRIEKYTSEVCEMIADLPLEFFPLSEGGKDGWSFLNLPMDRDGNQWCEQRTAEQLLCLSIAMGKAEYLLPRELWSSLPGSVPYVQFSLQD